MFAAYVRTVWIIQAVTQCYGGSSVGGFFGNMNSLLFLLVLLTAATASRKLFLAATLVRTFTRISSMPYIWEVELWAVLMDLTLLAVRCEPRRAADAIRGQMIVFYAGAAFWKLNTSFLDASTSCGTIFFAQLIAAFAPSFADSAAIAALLRIAAPVAAVAVELAVPLLLTVWRRGGLALALLFHLLVVLTPPPNNAGGFSVCAAQYLFFFAPAAVASLLAELRNSPTAFFTVLGWSGAALAIGSHVGRHQFFFDTAPCAYGVQLVLLVAAVLRHGDADSEAQHPPNQHKSTSARPLRRTLPVGASAVYAFVLPTLGLMDQMAPNMFSNQRFHGGSNHLFAPTGLVHALLPTSTIALIRIHSTTSTHMRAQYPAEVTASFTPAARKLLHAVGHTGRQWNPMLGRVVGVMAIAGPTPDDARAKPPVQYSIPALELRRLIAEARAKNESFELEYAHLEGGRGTEHWRATSAVKTIVYRYDAAASRASCHALYQSAATGRRPSRGRCADDEIAMLPPPPWWALWLIAFQPLPILAGEAWAEVHCYGP